MIPVKINGQFDIILPRHRAERQEWFTEQGWEKARLQSMHDHIGKGDVVYYVGVEMGDMAALCQMWGARMVLFEPNPKAWPSIKETWEANNLRLPTIFCGFASDITRLVGSSHFEVDTNGWPRCANNEIEAAHGFKELDKEADNYSQRKLDDMLPVAIPTVICIDSEGSEGRVLRGAEQTLRKHKPLIYLSLHAEFLIMQYGEHAAELRKWIMDLGYKETLLDFALHETHLLYEDIND